MNWRSSLIVLAILCPGCGPLGTPARVKAPPGNYDLASESITWSPDPVHVGDEVVFTFAVNNLGSDTIPGRTYDVEFYIGGELVSFDRATMPLDPGLPSTYSKAPGYFHLKPTQPGQVKYRLVLDPGNRLAETDESNNVVEGYVEVQPP